MPPPIATSANRPPCHPPDPRAKVLPWPAHDATLRDALDPARVAPSIPSVDRRAATAPLPHPCPGPDHPRWAPTWSRPHPVPGAHGDPYGAQLQGNLSPHPNISPCPLPAGSPGTTANGSTRRPRPMRAARSTVAPSLHPQRHVPVAGFRHPPLSTGGVIRRPCIVSPNFILTRW